jgi:dihydrolipoamide dehydrogenase
VLVDSPFASVERTPGGVRVTLSDGSVLEAELMLVAVGRGPRTDDLGFGEVGVELDGAFVKVDERCRTSLPGVFAVGDITPGPQLAHRGFQQGIFVAEEIAGQSPESVPDDQIPRVVYSEPEVASVGLTEEAARNRLGDSQVEVLTYDLGGNGKSQILRTQGFVKLVREKDGPVVGVHMVGSRVGELISEAQLVVGWTAHPEDVAPFVHAHPTQGEALGEAHLALAGKALHAHG